MESMIESLFSPPPRIQRAWQWTGLVLLCLSQQGCMCGCSHHQTPAKAANSPVPKDVASGFSSRPVWDGKTAAITKDGSP